MHNIFLFSFTPVKRTETICYTIKTAWHAINRMYNNIASKEGITTSIGYVLLNIDAKEGTPATKIAPLIGLESRSLTRMLKSLEETKLIYRAADINDKRSVRIFLTEKGKEKREVARQSVKKFNNLVFDKVTPEKLAVFFEVAEIIQQTTDINKP
jgi:MarR family transcriptional regulator, organic hydroperoxide resistance regulator